MNYDYSYLDAENTIIRRKDDQGNIVYIPVSPGNSDYAKFLSSGATAAPYVERPEQTPPEPTPEEKLARSGLTVEELKGLLGLN